jgi:orotate phosphoribosyltransferase
VTHDPDLGADIRNACLLHGQFLLRSGQVRKTYFDKYRFEADPKLLDRIARRIVELVPDEVDALAGLELGGVPLAVALSRVTGLPARFVRKVAKTYGTCALAEGGEVTGQRLLVVEDIVTTGGQVIASSHDLRNHGAIIKVALCVIQRDPDATARLSEAGIELRALFNESELLRA